MSSFSLVLLEEGVEVEIPGDLHKVIALLDQEVPKFSRDGYRFQLRSTRAQLGSRWDLVINSVDPAKTGMAPAPIGRIELETLDESSVVFRIPPRSVESFEDVEHLQRRDSLSVGRQLPDFDAAIACRNRIDPGRPVIFEILLAKKAPDAFEERVHHVGHFAAVEDVAAAGADFFERVGQPRILENLALAR